MGLIADRDHALRLARAILADIRLYHEEEIRGGRLEPSVVDEARELYRSRAEPNLHGEFERELSEFYAANGIASVPNRPDEASEPSRTASRADRFASTSLDAEDRSSGGTAILVAVLLVIVALAAAAALLFLR